MPTNQAGDSQTAHIDNDPFPSTVIAANQAALDDDGAYGVERQKPDFVRRDDENFEGA